MKKSISGFTLVELLIAIVVIAILAAISVVAYNGVQERARDNQRYSDIKIIAKALELYYVDHGQYPTVASGSPCVNEHGVARSACPNWNELADKLSSYISTIPKDPINRNGSTGSPTQHTYFYSPFPSNNTVSGCPASAPYQGYRLVYFPENPANFTNEFSGNCATSRQPGNYYSATYSRGYTVTKP